LEDTELIIRVRSTLAHTWQWELMTKEGHVVDTSPAFAEREECEQDADRQGVPVHGARRLARGIKVAPAARSSAAPWVITKAGRGLWQWESAGEDGVLVQSTRSFLSKQECIADAESAFQKRAGEPAKAS
jgi:hypothetical protein